MTYEVIWKSDTTEYRNGRRVRVHHLKCAKEAFDAIKTGTRKAEFRNDNRRFSTADVLCLYCLNSKGEVEEFSPTTRVSVTHKQIGLGIPEGYCMLSVQLIYEKGDEDDE